MIETREASDPGTPRRPASHNRILGGSLERVSERVQALTEEITEWVDLKLKLAQLEVEERVEARIRGIVMEVAVVALAGVTGLFALTTLAFALGAWLGHPAWGFLIVTGLLGLVTLILRSVNQRRKRDKTEIDVTEASRDAARLPAPDPARVDPSIPSNSKAPTVNGKESYQERS